MPNRTISRRNHRALTTRWRGSSLVHAVVANKVKQSQLDDRVRAVLKLVNRASKSEIPTNATEMRLDRPEDRRLLRKVAADSVVLLKNENIFLPFEKEKRTLVIGPNSKIATFCGGGSASLNPYYVVTPFDAVQEQYSAGVDFSQGAYGHQSLPGIGGLLKTVDGKKGFELKVYNDAPGKLDREFVEEMLLEDSAIFSLDYNHPKLATVWYADALGVFTPTEGGIYDFGVSTQGTARLYIDDELIVDNTSNQKSGSSFLGAGTIEEIGYKELVAQWGCAKTSTLKAPGVVDFGHGGIRFSGCKRLDPQEAMAEAARVAKDADQVVLFAGLSGEWETEGQDRTHMNLPPYSDELITKIIEAKPDTVVVIQSGTPYGCNETGNGIADVLFGNTNPSGKSPLTFPRRLQDNPAFLNYRSEGSRVLYGEDIYVGYRYFDKIDLAPLFPFGHGLSYTRFQFGAVQILRASHNQVSISTILTNIGSCAGAEVVQVYIAPESPRINRPIKELKGFKKVFLQPGEETSVEVILDERNATSFWDEYQEKWCSQKDTYKVLVGNSSRGDFMEASFQTDHTSYWLGL